MDLEGAAGVLTGAAEEDARGRFRQMLLNPSIMRITGGGDEILRNMIAERVLGCPANSAWQGKPRSPKRSGFSR